jgi:tRNA threonylcarbamoyladenosine biosynthesis protein TsaB
VLVKLLALDAATEACSVALLANGEVREREALEARAQSQLLLPMIDSILGEAGLRLEQLDALVVGRGPGSFTGVRLAVGVAQGLAYGARLRVIPVSDLAMLAQGAVAALGCDHVVACMDARMDETYWCSFMRGADGLVTPLHEERLGPPDSVVPPVSGPFVGVGTGWTRHEQLRTKLATSLAALAPNQLPHARDALALAAPLWRAGATLAPEQVLPVYLRDEVATRPRR